MVSLDFNKCRGFANAAVALLSGCFCDLVVSEQLVLVCKPKADFFQNVLTARVFPNGVGIYCCQPKSFKGIFYGEGFGTCSVDLPFYGVVLKMDT